MGAATNVVRVRLIGHERGFNATCNRKNRVCVPFALDLDQGAAEDRDAGNGDPRAEGEAIKHVPQLCVRVVYQHIIR